MTFPRWHPSRLTRLAAAVVITSVISSCGSLQSVKDLPQDSGAFNQIGVLTSSHGPQCTATVLHSASGMIIATAAHCLRDQTDLRFAPRHDGENPRFSTNIETTGTNPLRVWHIVRPAYLESNADFAFLIVEPINDENIEKAVGGGWSLAARSPAGGGWTAYGYDVNWTSTSGSACPAPAGTPKCQTDYEAPHRHLHQCNAPVQASRVNAGSVVITPCAFGDYASGGPWIDASYRVGAIGHGAEFDPGSQEYGTYGTPLGADSAMGGMARRCFAAADDDALHGRTTSGPDPCAQSTLPSTTPPTRAAPPCNKRAARQELATHGLLDAGFVGVDRLICRDFTGDGRRDMAFTRAVTGSAGTIGWGIFIADKRRWRLALVREDETQVGIKADGRELLRSRPIHRPGDANCCPTGGATIEAYRFEGGRFAKVGESHDPNPHGPGFYGSHGQR
jgi:hypothetical protein